MGRRFPAIENSSIHPAISFPLLVVSMAATIAIVTALCGARFRKKSSPPPPPPPPSSSSPDKTTDKMSSPADLEEKTEKKMDIPIIQEPLKPPPMRQLRESSSYSCDSSNTVQDAGLKTSMSLRVARSMSMAKNRSRKEKEKEEERQQKKKDKMKSEDSVWMKTIILGEKCRVPDEDDDAIIYDDKGNRISTYHPKTPRSLPPSRQCSFIDPQAIPS